MVVSACSQMRWRFAPLELVDTMALTQLGWLLYNASNEQGYLSHAESFIKQIIVLEHVFNPSKMHVKLTVRTSYEKYDVT